MDPKDLEALVGLSDRLDAEGHAEEAQALDTVLARVAQHRLNKSAMSGKAQKACASLLRACQSFCNKNLDARGENRREMNSVCDMAEDLCEKLEKICGSNGAV